MTDFGSGLSLDEQWDLYVDESSGDLAFSEASEEVRKDLAFNVARLLTAYVGEYMSDGRRADIRLKVKKLIEADDRIEEVNQIEVRTPNSRPDELEVDIVATTVTGVEIDDVFTAA